MALPCHWDPAIPIKELCGLKTITMLGVLSCQRLGQLPCLQADQTSQGTVGRRHLLRA